ncbi:MAG: HIT domain-containing protein [Patescibacteria group bacterium]
MLYTKYLEKMKECPFCETKDRIFISKPYAYLTYAKCPYHPHHLLVIPKRHITSFFDITDKEQRDINQLIKAGTKILKKLNYNIFTILVREGDKSAKSIKHLHYHLIPNDPIGDLNHVGEPRKMLSKKEIEKLSAQILSIIN